MGARAFVGRQPIVDRDQRVVGYEILYRASADAQSAVIEDPSQAALQVMANTFATLGPDAVLGDGRGFFNVNREVLLSDQLEALPTDRVMIEVLECVVVDEAVLRRCKSLAKKGYSLALDDWVPGDERGSLLPFVKMVKVDLPLVPVKGLRKLVRDLSTHGVSLLAEKVETQDEFDHCLSVGFDLFQGYFFAKPVIVEGASLDASKVILIQLMQLCMADGDTDALVDQFKQDAKLSLNLLRVVNSAGRAGRVRFETIEEAIMQLGRDQLGRWLSILLYANTETGGLVSPLFHAAAHRGRLMERIASLQAEQGAAPIDAERAFMVGMLSLADALLGRPLEELVAELGLADDIAGSLLERAGRLGALLDFAEAVERSEIDKFEPQLGEWSLNLADLQKIENETYRWLHGVASGASDGGDDA